MIDAYLLKRRLVALHWARSAGLCDCDCIQSVRLTLISDITIIAFLFGMAFAGLASIRIQSLSMHEFAKSELFEF